MSRRDSSRPTRSRGSRRGPDATRLGRPRIDLGGRRRIAGGVPAVSRGATIRSDASGSSTSTSPTERLVFDPTEMQGEEHLSAEERDRRERRREPSQESPTTPPIARCTMAAFAMGGRLFLSPTWSNGERASWTPTARDRRSTRGPIRPGDTIAYVADGALRVADVRRRERPRARDRSTTPMSSWGLAGLRRRRGDGAACAATGGPPTASGSPSRASTNVPCASGTSPGRLIPERRPRAVRYPARGNRQRHRHALGRSTWTAAASTSQWDRRGVPVPGHRRAGDAHGPLTLAGRVAGSAARLADPAAPTRRHG